MSAIGGYCFGHSGNSKLKLLVSRLPQTGFHFKIVRPAGSVPPRVKPIGTVIAGNPVVGA